MVIVIVDNDAETYHNETYAKDIEHFNRIVGLFRDVTDNINARNGCAAMLNRTPDNMVFRSIAEDDRGNTAEHMVIASIIHDSPIAHKKWVKDDRMVENSQGGTTHFKAWSLQ